MQSTNHEVHRSTQPARTSRRALRSPLVAALGALLVVQLAAAALALGIGGSGMEPAGSQGPLLTFQGDQVKAIRIQTPEGEPVLLAKTDNGWAIPALGDLPAAEHKVTGLLSKLEGLQKGLPVATSEEALKRFKVADQSFERKLTLEQGDSKPAILYLGDSPGFRRLFVRAADDTAVYEAELGLFDVPDKADDWSDRTLLHLDAEKIQRLTLADLTLERSGENWRLTDLAEGEEQDQQAIEDAVRRIANIDFLGVLEDKEEPALSKDTSPLEIEATLAGGETVSYTLTKLAEGNDYLLKASNRPQRFTIADYTAKRLTAMDRSDLLKGKKETAEDSSKETPAAQAGDTAAPAAEAAAPDELPEGGETGPSEPEEVEPPAAVPAPATPKGPNAQKESGRPKR